MNPWLHSLIKELPTSEHNVVAQSNPVNAVRAQSLSSLTELAWPTRKTEAWRYTSLKPLEAAQLAYGQPAKSATDITAVQFADQDSIDLLVVDGVLQTDISRLTLPKGISIQLVNADSSTTAASWFATCYGKIKPEHHVFGVISDAVASAVIAIEVADNTSCEIPIRIICSTQTGQQSYTRLAVNLGANAQATVIEQLQSPDAQSASQLEAQAQSNTSFTSLISEYRLQADSSLTHLRLGLLEQKDMSVGGCHFELAEKADLHSHFIGLGSQLARTDVDILHRGEYANAKFNSVYLLQGSEQFDLHATVEHEVPNCTTEENIRGIVADQAQATFNGRIHIHRDAQKTLAELNNRNLLLSDEAQINTKPELEIYADDVRCAHGATVAEIDDDAVFYLTSRGVSAEQALMMLNFGFINELLDDIALEPVQEWLRQVLRQRFLNMGEK